MTCRKQPYRTRAAATAAAHTTRRHTYDWALWQPYRCRSCRFGDGQKAWHWGHLARGRAR